MKVTVIGGGVMGPGIAQVWMMGGYETTIIDINLEALSKGTERIRHSIAMMKEMDSTTVDLEKCMSLLTTTNSLPQALDGANLIIEAVPERLDIKQALYKELDQLSPSDAIIVSNTSSLPLPHILPHFRPDKFFICHFFNPPEIIPLVEIVQTGLTDPKSVGWLTEVLKKCGKTSVVLSGFVPGFLVNRLQTAMAREALYLIDKGVAQPEDVDTAVKAVIGFKSAWQGMFDTMDYIGLDTVALAYDFIFPDLCNDVAVPETIRQKVQEGSLGVKSGRGFFNYEGEEGAAIMERRQDLLLEQLRLWRTYMDDK